MSLSMILRLYQGTKSLRCMESMKLIQLMSMCLLRTELEDLQNLSINIQLGNSGIVSYLLMTIDQYYKELAIVCCRCIQNQQGTRCRNYNKTIFYEEEEIYYVFPPYE